MTDNLLNLIDDFAVAEADDDFDLPKYSDVGWILVSVGEELERQHHWQSRHEYDVLGYSGSAFWINEGLGCDYWINDNCEFPGPGVYVIDGITGTYYRGDGWSTDDDEEFEYKLIRQATEEETRTETVEEYGPPRREEIPDPQ